MRLSSAVVDRNFKNNKPVIESSMPKAVELINFNYLYSTIGIKLKQFAQVMAE